MSFENIKLEDLNLNFSSVGFGPGSEIPDHILKQFDGKVFKPYSKKEKLGKLCEFTLVPSGTGLMVPSVSQNYKQNMKKKIAIEDSAATQAELVDVNNDGFTAVGNSNRQRTAPKQFQQTNPDTKMSVANVFRAKQKDANTNNQAYQTQGFQRTLNQTKNQQKRWTAIQTANANM